MSRSRYYSNKLTISACSIESQSICFFVWGALVVNGFKEISAFFVIYLDLPYNIPWNCTAGFVTVHQSNIPGQAPLLYSKSPSGKTLEIFNYSYSCFFV